MGVGRTTNQKEAATLQVGLLIQICIRFGQTQYKARLFTKGFKQEYDVDYDEIFSPIVKVTTLWLLLDVLATEDLELKQMDMKMAFLHEDFEEDIYMSQPEGFMVSGEQVHHVC